MTLPFFRLRRLAAALALILLPAAAIAQDAESRLGDTTRRLETDLDARIGVLVRDSATGREWGHRQDERFLMASTFKAVLCGAVLAQADRGALTLDEPIPVRKADILDYAPVTETRVGQSMTVADLCLAALDMSDNTAANLLIGRLGGPGAVTAFLRRIGDGVTRLDRMEPDVNIFAPGDPRDTTTPAAMLASLQAMLTRDALTPASGAQLAAWMSRGGVTGKLIRAAAPEGWKIADKSGAGDGFTRTLIAMVTPPGRAPWFVAIYLSDSPADFAARDAAVAEIAAAVVAVIAER